MLQDMRRVQYITRRYNALQSLPLIVVGVLLLFAEAWRIWLVPHGLPFAELLTVIVALIIGGGLLVLSFFGMRYYQRNFGLVGMTPGDRSPALLKNGGFFILCLLGDSIDRAAHPAVSMLALFLSIAFFIYWWLMDRVQIYYLVSTLLLLIIGLLPVFRFNFVFHIPALIVGVDPYWAIVGMTIGFIFIICGLLDHVLLLRSFSSIAREIRVEGKQPE